MKEVLSKKRKEDENEKRGEKKRHKEDRRKNENEDEDEDYDVMKIGELQESSAKRMWVISLFKYDYNHCYSCVKSLLNCFGYNLHSVCTSIFF